MALEKSIAAIPQALSALSEIDPSCGLPVYCSIDIRDASFKSCGVDVNLFPAGFNQLDEAARQMAAKRMRDFFSAKLMTTPPWEICVVPEAHTNNKGYLENLAGIIEILEMAGAHPRLMWSGPPIPKPWSMKTSSGKELNYLPSADALEGAQALLLNHDLSGGLPKALEGVKLPCFPSPKLGWYRRKKSDHFEIAAGLLDKIAERVEGFDPWHFQAQRRQLLNMNLATKESLDRLEAEATSFFKELHDEYTRRGIEDAPAVFMKNDAGTYGMGVLSFSSLEMLKESFSQLKRKFRVGKESVPVTSIILQEGIPTCFSRQTSSDSIEFAEPVMYLVHGTPVGGFFRSLASSDEKGRLANLNQPGSKLDPLVGSGFSSPCGRDPTEQMQKGGVYHFLCRLHATAAALEECP